MVANILRTDPPPPPNTGWGQKVKKFNFSEYGPAAYQIKLNQEGKNMVASILPAEPLDPVVG